MDWDVWGPPLIILAGGLIIGGFVALRSRGAASPRTATSREEELKAMHANLMEQLRELEADRDKMTSADYRQEKERLVDAAAETLRDLEAPGEVAFPEGAAPAPANTQTWVGLAASVAFFVLLGVLISQNATQRTGDAPITGGIGGGGEPAPEQVSKARQDRVRAAQSALEADPKDLRALNTLTYDALLYNDLNGAMQYIEKAREIEPVDQDVQIHLAILSSRVSMMDRAASAIQSAEKSGPETPKLLLWRGYIYGRMGRYQESETDLRRAAGSVEMDEERILASGWLREVRAGPAAAPPAQPGAGAGAGAAVNPSASSAPRMSGTITLADGARPPAGGVLFIYAKRSDATRGPPLAAVKITQPTFPFTFSVSDQNLLPMAGGQWPEQVWLSARLDADGDAMSRSEQDLNSAVFGPLSVTDAPVDGMAIELK
ncbi:MAG: hypothetical protein AAFV53_22115 [Myxococcota bacterium]